MRKSITVEIKKTIPKHKSGTDVSKLSAEWRIGKSTICIILFKRKEKEKHFKGIMTLNKSQQFSWDEKFAFFLPNDSYNMNETIMQRSSSWLMTLELMHSIKVIL